MMLRGIAHFTGMTGKGFGMAKTYFGMRGSEL
jgi:hypothetical protein